jgi:hypothetical protein
MKKILRLLLVTILVIFILAQFYPRPKKNRATTISPNDISFVHNVTPQVLQILKTSCYDCHSNNTDYPWYSKIQPVASWLGNHIEEGKKELNFSEFGSYSLRRQYGKLEEINKEVKNDDMPLGSYTLIHRDAILTDEKKIALANWVVALRDSFKLNYPVDSLRRKR